jgi:hypothetical protein
MFRTDADEGLVDELLQAIEATVRARSTVVLAVRMLKSWARAVPAAAL